MREADVMRVCDISNYDYDQDITNPDGWIPAFKAEGAEGVIIGSQWMDKARWQLAKCKEQGMPVIATYAEPNVETAIILAQEAGCSTVCIVIEPGGIQDVQLLRNGIAAVRAVGFTPILYGNRGDVLSTAGADEFKSLGLWFASYFDDRRVITAVDFWPNLWGHQFTSTWMIAGKNRDVSEVFAQEDDMTDAQRVLIRIANDPDYTKTLESYDAIAAAGFLAPLPPFPGDGGVQDLNALLLRIKGLTWVAMSDNAEKAYAVVK